MFLGSRIMGQLLLHCGERMEALLQSTIGNFYKICGAVRSSAFRSALFPSFRADLSIRKSSSFFPPLIAATSQRGFAPRPAHVSPERLRYFGGTFLPLNEFVRRVPRALSPPIALSILSNCFSISARHATRRS